MRARNAVLGLVAMIAAGALVQGCGDSNSEVLAEAVFARDVPVYKGAKHTESMGNESWGDEPDSYTRGMTWWFETRASKQELLDYYTKLYPNAERIDLDDGAIELRWVPQGATRFEDVSIVVDNQEFRIGESVSPNTRQRLKEAGAAAASHDD